jgi:hypothetical protein
MISFYFFQFHKCRNARINTNNFQLIRQLRAKITQRVYKHFQFSGKGASVRKIYKIVALSALLGWREFSWDENAAMHFADQRNSVSDAFIPSGLLPRILASLLAFLVRSVAPDVVNVVQATDLREESGVGFVILASEVDRTRPVVSPFDHGSGLEAVRAHFIDVVATAGSHHGPIAERQ